MNHFQVAVALNTLPIQLVCISDASVAFVRTQDFSTIIEDGASFANGGFTIGGINYEYNKKIYYKQIPDVLEWLVRQKLEMPLLN